MALLTLAGCGQGEGALTKKPMSPECLNGHTVKCWGENLDSRIFGVRHAIKTLTEQRERINACKNEVDPDEAIRMLKEQIAYYEALRPGFFTRHALFWKEMAFEFPPFEHQAKLDEFENRYGVCKTWGWPDRRGVAEKIAAGIAVTAVPVFDSPVVVTPAGKLVNSKMLADSAFAVTLDDAPVFTGKDARWQAIEESFSLPDGREATLVKSAAGTEGGCENRYFFLLSSVGGVKPTPKFGSCAKRGKASLADGIVRFEIAGKAGAVHYAFDGVTVTEDGQPVVLDESNDPAK